MVSTYLPCILKAPQKHVFQRVSLVSWEFFVFIFSSSDYMVTNNCVYSKRPLNVASVVTQWIRPFHRNGIIYSALVAIYVDVLDTLFAAFLWWPLILIALNV